MPDLPLRFQFSFMWLTSPSLSRSLSLREFAASRT
jgi:hypothetical protein